MSPEATMLNGCPLLGMGPFSHMAHAHAIASILGMAFTDDNQPMEAITIAALDAIKDALLRAAGSLVEERDRAVAERADRS